MKKTTAFFAIISMIMLLSGFLFADAGGSDNAKSAGAAYLWLDGTQAPSACVAECTGFGIHVVEKENGDTKYLSDACKSVCLDSTASAQAGTEGTAANDNANGTVVVGGDKDIHGCIGSAGYTWCGAENKCIRSWEEACPESSCPQLMPPSQQLQDNCTAQGKALGKVTKDGCAVGYECSGIENETETGSPDNTSEGSAREGNESNIRAGNACAAPEGLYRNMLEYTNMLANAENGNDSAAYAQISEKIGNTQKAMAEAMKQCGDVNAETNVSAGMEASPAGEAADNQSAIYAYYRARVDNVTASSSDAQTKVHELIAIKSDVEDRIAQIINGSQGFDSAEISQVVDKINVTPTAIAAGSVNVEATGKSIALDASSGRLDISQGNGFVSLRQGGTEATANSITISNNTITIGNGQVRVLPAQARAIMGGTMRSLQLEDDSGMPVYVANISTDAKIFGFIPATYEKTKVISAETGVTITEDKPWWSVLAIEQPAQNST